MRRSAPVAARRINMLRTPAPRNILNCMPIARNARPCRSPIDGVLAVLQVEAGDHGPVVGGRFHVRQ
jgi:hypothetical protein